MAMKHNVILMFSCFFTLFLMPAAQASDFVDNTCHGEGANCQTMSDWMIGWCEAASAAGTVDQTVEECAQSVGANHPDMQVVPTPSQNAAQNQNPTNSASSSKQSSGARQSSSDNTGASGDSGAQSLQGHTGDTSDAERAAAPDKDSSKSDTQYETCQSYRVTRNNPARLVCVRPSRGSAKDYDESEEVREGTEQVLPQ